MAFNKNELLLDRVRSLVFKDPETGKIRFRLTSIEDPTLGVTADSEEIVDALGSPIATLYRAKRGTFSGTNSVVSLDLAANQYGGEKIVASSNNKIKDYTYEILAITSSEGTASVPELKYEPIEESVAYIYAMEDGEVGTAYELGTTASATNFAISGKQITLPTGLTSGKIYVEYEYENENAVEVDNYASKFPDMGSLLLYAYFRDKCNENIIYSGKVIAEKAKLSPEVELNLTSTGKHPFSFTFNRDYCEEEGKLFAIIVSGADE